MGADEVVFAIRFCENKPTGAWKDRKNEIADFIANCWFGSSAADSILRKTVTHEDYDWRDNGIFFELADLEFYGRICQCSMEMEKGLLEFYPDIDYEFHYYECYGGIRDDVSIYLGGKRYSKKQDFRRLKAAQYTPEENPDTHDSGSDKETMNSSSSYTAGIKPGGNRTEEIIYPSGLRWKVPKFK